jgi:hypothetical protein
VYFLFPGCFHVFGTWNGARLAGCLTLVGSSTSNPTKHECHVIERRASYCAISNLNAKSFFTSSTIPTAYFLDIYFTASTLLPRFLE